MEFFVVNFRESAFNLIINEIAHGIVQIPLIPFQTNDHIALSINDLFDNGRLSPHSVDGDD